MFDNVTASYLLPSRSAVSGQRSATWEENFLERSAEHSVSDRSDRERREQRREVNSPSHSSVVCEV